MFIDELPNGTSCIASVCGDRFPATRGCPPANDAAAIGTVALFRGRKGAAAAVNSVFKTLDRRLRPAAVP